MIYVVRVFSAKLSLYILQMRNKIFQYLPTVSRMVEGQTNVYRYCDLSPRLRQEFADRFSDFEKLESCVTFAANPFRDVDASAISAQMAELFCVDPVELGN